MSVERPEAPDHWMIFRCGIKIWNRWREANPETQPDLRGFYHRNADLRHADFSYAVLTKADLRYADLSYADLSSAVLTNADLSSAVLSYAVLTNANLTNADLTNANLSYADLTKADLGYADLSSSVLTDADLTKADLTNAVLRHADLGYADLYYAVLPYADLTKADLTNADLTNAGLTEADLSYAVLTNAVLSWAYLFSTHIHAVDLRDLKGLEEVMHRGASPVSSQTLERSQGQIPEKFLKGCGLKDWEILSAKLHDPNLRPDQVMDIGYEVLQIRATSPIVPLSVFISYSHANTSFVEKLEARFDKDRIRYWRDVHDLKAGPIEHQVDRAIGMQRATLLVLSEDSVDSDWVEHEVEHARKAEKKRQKEGRGDYLLCPIALDDSWKKCRWPERILGQVKKYTILDFSRWGSDQEFEKVYEKLKTGLGIYYADKGPPNDPGRAAG